MEEKKRSAGKTILTVLLVILLTIVGFAAYVLIRMGSSSFESDDVTKILANEPLDIDERFGADEEDRLTIRLNSDDIYYFLSKEYGEDFLASSIEEVAQSSGVKINAYKLEIKGGKPMVTITAKYNFLKLAASAVFDVQAVDGNRLVFNISKIRVAGMSFPASWIKGLDKISFDFKADTALLQKIEEVKGDGEYIVLAGPLSDKILNEVDPQYNFPRNYTYYLSDYREILDAGNINSTDKENAMVIFMNGVRELGFKQVIEDYFMAALPKSSKALMRSQVLIDRFLTPYKDTDFVAMHMPVTELVEGGRKNIDLLTDQVFRYFNLKKISIKDGKFYYGDKEFTYDDFIFEGWEEYYSKLIKPETFHLVLIDDEHSFKGNVGGISGHVDSLDSISEKVNEKDMYTLGYVVETAGGLKTICYNGMNSRGINFELKVYDLSDEEYERLISGDKVNIYHAQ